MSTQAKTTPEESMKGPQEAADTKSRKERGALLEASRKVLLASIGVIALAQDEIEDFVDRLVERGEIAEHDGRKLVREIMDRRKRTAHTVEVKMGKQVDEFLERLSIPTKADIEALSDKIAALTKKVEELKKDKDQA
jgi:poly(hydroxyalkanoate) granule-associated protein